MRNTFGTNLNFLDYNRVRLGIEKFKNKNGAGFQTRLPEKPIWPDTISLINKSKKGCKDFYNVPTECDAPKDLVHLKTWENLLQINIELKEWKNIHLACFKTILDNQIIWLQYRILRNILGTKALLYKMKGPRWQSGNTLASHLCGRGSIPVMAVSGKAGSCLPLVGSLQYTTLANSMYWFPLPFQLPVVI